jgi:hypothetical protein
MSICHNESVSHESVSQEHITWMSSTLGSTIQYFRRGAIYANFQAISRHHHLLF